MLQPEQLIKPANAARAMRYILNLDVHAIEEKYQKIGVVNLVDVVQAKRCYGFVTIPAAVADSDSKNAELTQQATTLASLLNSEARAELSNFLAASRPLAP